MNARPVSPASAEPATAAPGVPAEVVCAEARTDEERLMHHGIRHAVFVEEQGMFVGSDLDAHDRREDLVRVLAFMRGQPVGTVRLYLLEEHTGLWKGDRLAVLPAARTCGAGAPLVRYAVAYARSHGGQRMIAQIQLANVRFFERLGWSAYEEAEDYLGLRHQPMQIALHGDKVTPE
ncbi:MSMEG_0567/Sll0786 family nitrogen starvation N-acetyltransferase [Terrabacter sp. MAHUQ-38]|uniref:MSMEG_0567/Sll0786 family nitrogen starvation N-acetyltransferase n=1 Tax=unclassified Terrabacter TaxID=2630222 RepID=UPI00199056F0|nr:GNAT family N-acetyltransferase [Terrabacter sp. MAHUQ-38]